ncbi:hypothetical protein BLSTO_02658 [Blastocystis sp. subtype 1]
MSSKSFGEWYKNQKEGGASSASFQERPSKSWFSSFLPSQSQSDVESTGLLHSVTNVGTRITETSQSIRDAMLFGSVGVLFFLIAYIIGIPTLLFRPAKFAISFTMGSFMIIVALATVRGPRKYFASVFQSPRILKTTLYLLSLLSTLFFSLVKRSYVGTVVSSVFQIVMLVLFIMESVPSLKAFVAILTRVIGKVVSTKQTFWFYVAALYKLSMIPFLLSPFYLIYMLFTMDLVNFSSHLTPMTVIALFSVLFFLLIALVEYKPDMITRFTPKSFINTEQAFVNQHRILIVYLRYIYFYLLFIMMTKVNGFYVNYILHKDADASAVAMCMGGLTQYTLKYLIGVPVLILSYWLSALYVKRISEVKLF